MEVRNRFPKTASGPESSFSLTRQAQTNHYDRRIWLADRFSDFFQQAADSKSQIRKSASQPAGHRYLLKEDQRDGLRINYPKSPVLHKLWGSFGVLAVSHDEYV
jgi:hypothetical protein